MGRRARTVTLKLRYGDFTTITRSRTLREPTQSDDTLYRAGAELLRQALSQDGRAVRLLGLGASEIVDDTEQLALFDDKSPKLASLLRSIDRLREKYGHHTIQTGLTFFDDYAGSEDWEPERRTGLSSQIGRKSEE
jgi:DNA polymerase-4